MSFRTQTPPRTAATTTSVSMVRITRMLLPAVKADADTPTHPSLPLTISSLPTRWPQSSTQCLPWMSYQGSLSCLRVFCPPDPSQLSSTRMARSPLLPLLQSPQQPKLLILNMKQRKVWSTGPRMRIGRKGRQVTMVNRGESSNEEESTPLPLQSQAGHLILYPLVEIKSQRRTTVIAKGRSKCLNQQPQRRSP